MALCKSAYLKLFMDMLYSRLCKQNKKRIIHLKNTCITSHIKPKTKGQKGDIDRLFIHDVIHIITFTVVFII